MAFSDKQIGRNVSLYRGELSQKDLADAMRRLGWKWSQATLWAIERGDRPLRLAEARDLAEILEIRIDYLLGTDEDSGFDLAFQQLARATLALDEGLGSYLEAMSALAVAIDDAPADHPRVNEAASALDVSPIVLIRALRLNATSEKQKSVLDSWLRESRGRG